MSPWRKTSRVDSSDAINIGKINEGGKRNSEMWRVNLRLTMIDGNSARKQIPVGDSQPSLNLHKCSGSLIPIIKLCFDWVFFHHSPKHLPFCCTCIIYIVFQASPFCHRTHSITAVPTCFGSFQSGDYKSTRLHTFWPDIEKKKVQVWIIELMAPEFH